LAREIHMSYIAAMAAQKNANHSGPGRNAVSLPTNGVPVGGIGVSSWNKSRQTMALSLGRDSLVVGG
jgi:hypothetical protein